MKERPAIDVMLDELSIDLPPDLEVDRAEYLAGLVEELELLLETQGLPVAALHDKEVVRSRTKPATVHDSRSAGREAGQAVHAGISQ